MPRDVAHFEQLRRLVELEHQAQRERLALDRQTLPLAELEARGLVLLDVTLEEEAVGLGGRHLLTFRREDKRALRSALGPGDLVSVSPRKAPVDAPPSGVVTQARRTQLTVAFERRPPEWVNEGRLRLDVLANDVTTQRQRGTLATFEAMSSGLARDRREVLLGNAPPRFEKPKPPVTDKALNPEQLDAVALALAARDVALVHGPPGTGKSTVLAEIARQAVRRGQRVLCTAASNAAVDHLVDLCLREGLRAVRVGHPARVSPALQEHTLDLIVEEHEERRIARELFDEAFDLLGYASKQRSQGRSRSRFANAREAQIEARRLMDEARAREQRAVRQVLDGAQVTCATLSVLDGSLLQGRQFDLALVDEATQAVEPLTLAAFTKATTVILAGDPMQLGPTVLSERAQKEGLGRSLFVRLLEDYGEDVKRLLKEQHRMHAALMQFPSTEMYQGQLRAHPTAEARTLAPLLSRELDAPPLLFLDTAGKGFDEQQGEGTASLINEGEAELILARVRALVAAGVAAQDLAVITPYRAQAQLLRDRLAATPELEADTVDAFQGREKEAVLVSLVRSNSAQAVGFLADLRRMNVALTRARRHLFVVGDSATLSGHPFYARFLEHAHATGAYRSAWEWTEADP